jgi:hypothetical protein
VAGFGCPPRWAIASATAARQNVKHEDPTPERQAREKQSALRLHVQPTVGQAPMSVKVVIDVARDEENRWLVVPVESVEFYRSSRIQLDGSYPPALTNGPMRISVQAAMW